tara:strand:+ start:5771 stop:6418 length:648 start_codon:yes stop_codon:yes gene_type:complete
MNRQQKKQDEKVSRNTRSTKLKLLKAATKEFADKGLNGARVDGIASRAGVNKQLLYYYFGDKEKLFVAVLEAAYVKLRKKEKELHLEDMNPWQAIETLVGFTFDYIAHNRQFVALLNDENIHHAQHIKRSKTIKGLHSKLLELLSEVLKRGAKEGLFRKNVDPIEFYISLASLCYFFFSNNHTLSAIFARNLTGAAQKEARRKHIFEFITAYLKI